jgi:zinc D-Ala-D-Ala dipeptidase
VTTAAGGPVLLADPRIASIPIRDAGEPLVRLSASHGISVAATSLEPPLGVGGAAAHDAYAHVREGLAVRLERAATRLPGGLRLHVVEGYRTPAAQRAYFEAYRRTLLLLDPHLAPEEGRVLTSRFVAPPEVAGHPSGAAVDITLIDRHGRPLDMGTPIDATPEDSAGACYLDSPVIDADVRARRRVLAACLEGEGLVNYPTEWWHWSYGDRYWAFATGSGHANYGPIEAA